VRPQAAFHPAEGRLPPPGRRPAHAWRRSQVQNWYPGEAADQRCENEMHADGGQPDAITAVT